MSGPSRTGSEVLSSSLADYVDDACDRFEAAWKAGQRPLVESYLADGTPAEARPVLLRELLILEVAYRRQGGGAPTPEEYELRFPGDADLVRAAFAEVIPPEAPGAAARGEVGGRASLRRGPTLRTVDDPDRTDSAEGQPETPLSGGGSRPAAAGYEILEELGRGAMGVVYKARQLRPSRLVALKMILSGEHAGRQEVARFRREAEAVALAQHPNVVQIYEVGEQDGRPFFSLELVEGGTLAQKLAGGLLPVREAAGLVAVLAEAVHAVHQRGVVHRDLKPANVLLAADGTPKVSDFGLAKQLDGAAGQTYTGQIMGTPCYMAPEQAWGQARTVGPAADVYALGAILYELLTGQPPFKGQTVHETLEQVRAREPTPPSRLCERLPRGLEAICLACLRKQPAGRYPSSAALAKDLKNWLEDKPIWARPDGWLTRTRRFVRSHPRLSLVAALLAITAAVALVLLYYVIPKFPRTQDPELPRTEDPELPRIEAKGKLAKGDAYVVEGRERLPGPFRQVLGETAPLRPNNEESCFSVETLNAVLWELTDDPMCERYRFSAEVRHDDSGGRSLVGLYFGYRGRRSAHGTRQGGFYTLGFADRGGLVTRGRDGASTSYMLLESRLFEERSARPYMPFGPVGGKPFKPALPVGKPGPWRKLYVVVTPEGVEASWEKEPGDSEQVGFVSAQELRQRLVDLQRSIGELADVSADFRPRLGLGLYVSVGKASFRKVTLEPLVGGN